MATRQNARNAQTDTPTAPAADAPADAAPAAPVNDGATPTPVVTVSPTDAMVAAMKKATTPEKVVAAITVGSNIVTAGAARAVLAANGAVMGKVAAHLDNESVVAVWTTFMAGVVIDPRNAAATAWAVADAITAAIVSVHGSRTASRGGVVTDADVVAMADRMLAAATPAPAVGRATGATTGVRTHYGRTFADALRVTGGSALVRVAPDQMDPVTIGVSTITAPDGQTFTSVSRAVRTLRACGPVNGWDHLFTTDGRLVADVIDGAD